MKAEKESGMHKTPMATPTLEIRLSRQRYEAGERVSGIVVFRLDRQTGIRSLTVSVSGRETPAGEAVKRSLRRTVSFFDREILLSGMLQPRFTYERISQSWNAFLARDHGRVLSAGEHTYPFSIPLPTSLPPCYEGSAGKISYVVTARATFPTRRSSKASAEVSIIGAPRPQRSTPFAVTYPNSNGAVHANEVSVSLELPEGSTALGGVVSGTFRVNNPRRAVIREASVCLENCQWVRLAAGKELQRNVVGQHVFKPEEPEVEVFTEEFALDVPPDAPPSVEGTTISVIWILRMRLDTDPPIEFKAPVFVHLSARG